MPSSVQVSALAGLSQSLFLLFPTHPHVEVSKWLNIARLIKAKLINLTSRLHIIKLMTFASWFSSEWSIFIRMTNLNKMAKFNRMPNLSQLWFFNTLISIHHNGDLSTKLQIFIVIINYNGDYSKQRWFFITVMSLNQSDYFLMRVTIPFISIWIDVSHYPLLNPGWPD